ncbi:hypothetical protein DCMF_03690 [Candidatus Formimonas warabiya]|uniref:Major facilitator superfamily (MFS) profile domain-containing protein n=1 Tax=Formimonas warabiya TaxID=1761012 RepID=A0A3G1KNH4_FORW1|nr:hypothetical protein DCMF_03690 [Candidatus Formimonas warabiya]
MNASGLSQKISNNEPISKTVLWNKAFITIWVSALIMSSLAQMFNSYLPNYAISIGTTGALAGALVTVCSMGSLIMRPFAGHMIDRKQCVLAWMIGVFGSMLCYGSYIFIGSVALMLVMRTLAGFCYAFLSGAVATIASRSLPKEQLMEGMGYYGLAQPIATGIGPAVGLWIGSTLGYKAVMIFSFVMISIVACLGNILSKESAFSFKSAPSAPEPGEPDSENGEKEEYPGGFSAKVRIFSALMLFAITRCCVTSFIAPYTTQKGFGNISFFFFLYTVSIIVTRIIVGKKAGRLGFTRMMAMGIPALTASYVLLIWFPAKSILMPVGILFGIGVSLVNPTLHTAILVLFGKYKQGAANSAYYAACDSAFALGALMLGALLDISDYPFLFLTSTVIVVVTFILFYGVAKQLSGSFGGTEN